MQDSEGHSVVKPLFTIYGCFDWTGAAPRTTPGPGSEAEQRNPTESEPSLKELERLSKDPKR